MTTFRFSQRGQASTTSTGVAVFLLFYFTFIMILVWMVEGIPPMFLTKDVTMLGIGTSVIVLGAMALAVTLEKAASALIGTPAPVTAWHTIRFGILGAIAWSIGIPLLDAVTKSAMFTTWLTSIFIVIPFIVFTIAMYQVVMGGGGGS